MRTPNRLLLVLLAAAAVVGATPGSGSSSASSAAATTTFKGRFVCGTRPLAGARVELLGEPRNYSSFLGIHLTDFKVGFTVRGTVFAGPQGEWSFSVPRTSDTNYYVQVALDDGRGSVVAEYPATSASAVVPGAGGTNFNDVPVQDYHSQAYPNDDCRLWLALKDAYASYTALMGKRPPYGDALVQVGAPNRGRPYAAYTTIVWPRGSFATLAGVRHEFAHTIRNASLGSESAFLDEVSQGDFRVRGDVCGRTTPQYAFHEGWAEFWAGDFRPAPECPGGADDPAVEGAVAWTLTRLERNCAVANRRRMVETLLARGPSIHSLADFERALGVASASCLRAPLDASLVPRTTASPPVRDDRWSRDLRAALTATRGQITTLRRLAAEADRAAVSARCPAPPCLGAVARTLAPSLIRGRLAQARAAAASMQTQLSIGGQSLRGQAARRFLDSVNVAPHALASRLARIGSDSIAAALRAARPLARRDHSPRTLSVLDFFRSQQRGLAHAARSHAGSQYFPPLACGWVGWFSYLYLCIGTMRAGATTHAAPTQFVYEVTFDDIRNGTVITTQTAKHGAVFGTAESLHFPGKLPSYVCPAPPVAGGYGSAEAQSCGPLGAAFHYSGALARLRFPARNVDVYVDATAPSPGGIPVEVDAFDADGKLVTGSAALARAAYDRSTWDAQLVRLAPPLQSHAIVFVAIYANSAITNLSGATSPESLEPRVSFDNLSYREKKS